MSSFEPDKWFGKVTLIGLEDCAEFGTLEVGAYVECRDGKTYHGEWVKGNVQPRGILTEKVVSEGMQ